MVEMYSLKQDGFEVIFANRLEEVHNMLKCSSFDFANDTLTVYIKCLREKLEDDPQNPILIQTTQGLGYMVGE